MKKYTKKDLEKMSRAELRDLQEDLWKGSLKSLGIGLGGTFAVSSLALAILSKVHNGDYTLYGLSPLPIGAVVTCITSANFANYFCTVRDKANDMLAKDIIDFENSDAYGTDREKEQEYYSYLAELTRYGYGDVALEKMERLEQIHKMSPKVKRKRYKIVGRKND